MFDPRSSSGQLQGPLSTPGICLSIGHPVSDELSLFSFKIMQRKQATARTRPLVLSPANRLAPVVQHPSHSENHSCHRSSSAGIFVCVLPSLISDHTHLFTCDRQPLPLGPQPSTPPPCSTALYSPPPLDICVL